MRLPWLTSHAESDRAAHAAAFVLFGFHFYAKAEKVVFATPNAQVQGRALGVAEARSGGGIPCNAQLGDATLENKRLCMNLSPSCLAIELVFGLHMPPPWPTGHV